MSRALKTRLRAFEAALDRRHPGPVPPNPLEDFGPRYPGSTELLSDIWWCWIYARRTARPAPTLEAAARADPRVAALVARLAAEIRRQDAARGAEEPPRDRHGVSAAEVAASRARARAVADQFVRVAGVVR